MMDEREDRLDEWVRDAARDYNAPPPTPRAEMWEAIQAGRRAARVAPPPQTPGRPPRRYVLGNAALLPQGSPYSADVVEGSRFPAAIPHRAAQGQSAFVVFQGAVVFPQG